MTVSSTTAKNTYAGNGATTIFAYTFRILEDSHILVQEKVDATGVITTKTITTDYTVSGAGDDSGGNVTMVTAPASGVTLILSRNVPILQETDYVENDTFPAETHEEALDELTMIAQQINEQVDRSVKVDAAVSGFDATIPDPTANTDEYLKYNSAGTGFETVTLSTTAGLGNVVEDTSPQAGNDFDYNGFNAQFDDNTGIEDDSGNEQLIFQKTTSAVNYVEITNAATTNDPLISAEGDDTNINLDLRGKGAGDVVIGAGDLDIISGDLLLADTQSIRDRSSSELLSFASTASAVNEFNITNAATGTAPELSVSGDDTNIDMEFLVKGSGAYVFKGTSSTAAEIRLNEDTDNGTNYMALKAPAAVTTSTTLFLPDGDGTDGQVLTTDGSTNLSWTSKGAAQEAINVDASSTATLTTGVATKVVLDTENFDVASTFDSSTNYRWTPTTAGKYLVTAGVFFNINSDGVQVSASIYKNGSATETAFNVTGSTAAVHSLVSVIVDMNGSSDFLELYATHFKGSNGDLAAGSYMHGTLL